MTLTHLSLFSGIGGIDLAAHWAGFETVAFCEQNKFCQQVLGKHWPGVPIYDDIFTLTNESLAGRGVDPGSITLISGGFPCQPFSTAGKQKSHSDDRFLWPQMLRLIKEIRPRWVLGENVTGIINLALDDVLISLESAGYTARSIVIPACSVGAYHRRERVFIIANSMYSFPSTKQKCKREEMGQRENIMGHGQEQRLAGFMALSASERLERHARPILSWEGNRLTSSNWWPIEPGVGRVAHGIPRRVDRLKSLGNAVVPQQVYPILKLIADYESEAAA